MPPGRSRLRRCGFHRQSVGRLVGTGERVLALGGDPCSHSMDHTLRQGDRNRFAQGGWLNGCRLACSPFGDYVDHGPIGYLEIGGCKTADHFNTQESHIGVGEAQVDAESAGCDSYWGRYRSVWTWKTPRSSACNSALSRLGAWKSSRVDVFKTARPATCGFELMMGAPRPPEIMCANLTHVPASLQGVWSSARTNSAQALKSSVSVFSIWTPMRCFQRISNTTSALVGTWDPSSQQRFN